VRGLAALLILLQVSLNVGCQIGRRPKVAGLPANYAVKADQLLMLSDFKLPKTHPLITDLKVLRKQVFETLDLPYEETTVTVYLFEDEDTYKKYLQAKHPNLPHRRAYFLQHGEELAVYTYWGKRVQEDLRHEYTHGLLHSTLREVPLWLDEGLAEYFEVSGNVPGSLHPQYAPKLHKLITENWQPNLKRLEGITQFEEFSRADYRESWGWIHHLLHHSPETRQVLIGYLHDLQKRETVEPVAKLSQRLEQQTPAYQERLLKYLAHLPVEGMSQKQLANAKELRHTR